MEPDNRRYTKLALGNGAGDFPALGFSNLTAVTVFVSRHALTHSSTPQNRKRAIDHLKRLAGDRRLS